MPTAGRARPQNHSASPLRLNRCCSHTSFQMEAVKCQSYELPHQVGLQVAPAWVGLKKKKTQPSPHGHFISDNWGSSALPLCSACWARAAGCLSRVYEVQGQRPDTRCGHPDVRLQSDPAYSSLARGPGGRAWLPQPIQDFFIFPN